MCNILITIILNIYNYYIYIDTCGTISRIIEIRLKKKKHKTAVSEAEMLVFHRGGNGALSDVFHEILTGSEGSEWDPSSWVILILSR